LIFTRTALSLIKVKTSLEFKELLPMANVNQTLRAVEAFFSAGNELEANEFPNFLKTVSQALDSIEKDESSSPANDPVALPTPEPKEPENKAKSGTMPTPLLNHSTTAVTKKTDTAPKEKQSKKTKEKYTPIMPVKDSYGDDFVTCLICPTKNMKMLKNHLNKAHGLTPEEYRKELKLPDTHPIIAPAYTRLRSDAAKKNNLAGNMQAGIAKKAKAKKDAKTTGTSTPSTVTNDEPETNSPSSPETETADNSKSNKLKGPDFSQLNSPDDHI
jgi:predicted transcriptional regulator